MPTTTTSANPTRTRPLSKSALPAALAASKITVYSDNNPSQNSTTSSLPARGAAVRGGLHAPAVASPGYGSAGSGSFGTGGGAGSAIRTLAWSPTGALVATADARVARVWNPERAGVRYSTELKPPSSSSSSSTSTTARNGITAGATTTAAQAQGQGHLTGTERVAWNPTREAELASVGGDGIVRFWDVRARGACVGEVGVGGEGFSLAWRPGGGEVVIGRKDDTLVRIDRKGLAVVAQHPQPVQTNQLAFSNGGDELMLTTGDSQVKILDYPSMEPLHTLNAHTSSCYVVTPCPRGRHLAVGGSDALVTLWDTTDFVCRHSLADMTGPVRSVSFSFDGSYVVAGSDEGLGLMIAHVETGEYIHTIPTTHPAPCVAWHPSRYWLAYSGEPGGLKIVGAGGGPL